MARRVSFSELFKSFGAAAKVRRGGGSVAQSQQAFRDFFNSTTSSPTKSPTSSALATPSASAKSGKKPRRAGFLGLVENIGAQTKRRRGRRSARILSDALGS